MERQKSSVPGKAEQGKQMHFWKTKKNESKKRKRDWEILRNHKTAKGKGVAEIYLEIHTVNAKKMIRKSVGRFTQTYV